MTIDWDALIATVPELADLAEAINDLGTGGGGFDSFLYGDGSDGPIKFTATPRTITDGQISPGSTAFLSATANFTNADIGLVVDDGDSANQITPGTRITAVVSPSHATLSTAPSNTASGAPDDHIMIGSKWFFPGSYSSITLPTGAIARPIVRYDSSRLISEPASSGGWLCSGEYFIDGTLDLAGNDGQGVQGNSGIGVYSFTQWPPIGGNGGAGASGAGGPSWAGAATQLGRQPLVALLTILLPGDSAHRIGDGASGAGDGANNGGSGGSGGLPWSICARSIVHGPNALYTLTGGAGADGDPGDCGGGGGGADGWWITLSETLTGAPALVGGGGEGGAGTGTGVAGTDGEPGFGVHYTPGDVLIQTP